MNPPPDLLWHSAPPGLCSAFGQQARLVLRSMQRAGYRVALSTFESALDPALDPSSIEVLPAPDLSGHQLRENASVAFAASTNAPRAIAFTSLELIVDDSCEGIDLAFWAPFNFSPPPPKLLRYLDQRPIRVLALTKFAQRSFAEHGIASTYVPHGVDRSIFHPSPTADRTAARARFELEPDDFVVGVVAANNEWFGNRKSLPEIAMAFEQFRRNHRDALLLIHGDTTGRFLGGIDLEAVFRSLDVPPERVRSTGFDREEAALSIEEMADLYRSFDVLLAPSAGEGFGIPVIEAQACGVPVIVSNWATQAELVGAGWAVRGQPRWAPWVNSWQFTPSVPELVEAMEAAHRSFRPPLHRAIDFAARYDHDRCFAAYWVPFIDSWLETS